VGLQFEQVAQQAYRRLQPLRNLPMEQQWGRWEGKDRDGASLDVDVVSRLADGRMMTGGIKWNAEPLASSWQHHHIANLKRLAHAGQGWAHEALDPDAPILWVAAGGFASDFDDAVRTTHRHAVLLTLDDLYSQTGKGG